VPATPLRQAFSLKENLHALFEAPTGHLAPLDGLRALSILWVVCFHTGFYAMRFVPLPVYLGMLGDPWMTPVWRGDFGVDVFFVLSGFLIAGMLVDARERDGTIRLGRFYVRRLMRLWPALCVAALLEVLALRDNSPMIWANILYVSDFVPVLHVAMGWTWSLAIEEQFYLVCPWLVLALAKVGARGRTVAFACLLAGLAWVAASVVARGGFHAIDAEIVINRDLGRWAAGFDHLYAKPWMRASPLLLGVGAAYAYREPRVMAVLAERRVLAGVLFFAALVLAAVSTHWTLVEHAPRRVEIAFLALQRIAFGAAIAYVILFSLSKHPIGAQVGSLLSSRALYPIAQLAYGAYLLNPTMTVLMDRATASQDWGGEGPPMPMLFVLDAVATFAGATALYLFVERPFMRLRPRA